jgi:hypothetical protein
MLAILFSFPTWKNTTKKNQINIHESFSFQTKVNLEVIIAFSNLRIMFMA